MLFFLKFYLKINRHQNLYLIYLVKIVRFSNSSDVKISVICIKRWIQREIDSFFSLFLLVSQWVGKDFPRATWSIHSMTFYIPSVWELSLFNHFFSFNKTFNSLCFFVKDLVWPMHVIIIPYYYLIKNYVHCKVCFHEGAKFDNLD